LENVSGASMAPAGGNPKKRGMRMEQQGMSVQSEGFNGMRTHTTSLYFARLLLMSAIGVTGIGAWPGNSMVVLGGPNLDAEWQVKEHSGKAQVSSCNESAGFCVRLTSLNSSFSLEHSVDVNPVELPYLTWTWKVAQLPPTGDFRKSSTDDQAAQVLVAFTDHRVLSYIWDSNAPKGTMQSAGAIPLIHVVAVVCESGPKELNKWLNETRNVAADYERAFGKPAPRVKGVRLQINTQHTGSHAETYFGTVAFRSTLD
jgi:hypothetical protein